MFDVAGIWNATAHVLLPLIWGIGGYIVTRIGLRLLHRWQLAGELPLIGRIWALLIGMLLGLWQADWLDRNNATIALIKIALVVSSVMVLLHIVDRWVLHRLEAEGRANVIPRLMRDIGRGIVVIIALLLAISEFTTIQLSTILLSSTVLTVVVGLALQDLLRNVFSGIALQLERPFTPGDWIFIDSQLGFGRVLEMSWRAIRVRPRDGQVVVIPNSVVAQQQITNLSATGQPIAMRLKVAVDARHPPNQIYALLKQAVLSVDGVVAAPAPFVYTRELTLATATYEIKFWVDSYDHFPEQQGDALMRVWYVLQREGIALAPNEVVLTRPQAAATQHRRVFTSDEIIKHLRRIKLLDVLNDVELNDLAERVRVSLFAAGEVLAHQGVLETPLYAIMRGRVRVEVDHGPDTPPLVVSELGPGEVFGERGLLMNEPRSANVIAIEDTSTIVIDRTTLAPLLERNRRLPERLGHVLAQRQTETSEYLEEHARSQEVHAVPDPTERSLTQRIRSLFNL